MSSDELKEIDGNSEMDSFDWIEKLKDLNTHELLILQAIHARTTSIKPGTPTFKTTYHDYLYMAKQYRTNPVSEAAFPDFFINLLQKKLIHKTDINRVNVPYSRYYLSCNETNTEFFISEIISLLEQRTDVVQQKNSAKIKNHASKKADIRKILDFIHQNGSATYSQLQLNTDVHPSSIYRSIKSIEKFLDVDSVVNSDKITVKRYRLKDDVSIKSVLKKIELPNSVSNYKEQLTRAFEELEKKGEKITTFKVFSKANMNTSYYRNHGWLKQHVKNLIARKKIEKYIHQLEEAVNSMKKDIQSGKSVIISKKSLVRKAKLNRLIVDKYRPVKDVLLVKYKELLELTSSVLKECQRMLFQSYEYLKSKGNDHPTIDEIFTSAGFSNDYRDNDKLIDYLESLPGVLNNYKLPLENQESFKIDQENVIPREKQAKLNYEELINSLHRYSKQDFFTTIKMISSVSTVDVIPDYDNNILFVATLPRDYRQIIGYREETVKKIAEYFDCRIEVIKWFDDLETFATELINTPNIKDSFVIIETSNEGTTGVELYLETVDILLLKKHG
ncbi:MAG: hypothetical protein ACFFD4_37670, partial [Candidatus Odinarchaeota archaeon]